MENFKRPKNEKPYYYASSVINGEVIQHEKEVRDQFINGLRKN